MVRTRAQGKLEQELDPELEITLRGNRLNFQVVEEMANENLNSQLGLKEDDYQLFLRLKNKFEGQAAWNQPEQHEFLHYNNWNQQDSQWNCQQQQDLQTFQNFDNSEFSNDQFNAGPWNDPTMQYEQESSSYSNEESGMQEMQEVMENLMQMMNEMESSQQRYETTFQQDMNFLKEQLKAQNAKLKKLENEMLLDLIVLEPTMPEHDEKEECKSKTTLQPEISVFENFQNFDIERLFDFPEKSESNSIFLQELKPEKKLDEELDDKVKELKQEQNRMPFEEFQQNSAMHPEESIESLANLNEKLDKKAIMHQENSHPFFEIDFEPKQEETLQDMLDIQRWMNLFNLLKFNAVKNFFLADYSLFRLLLYGEKHMESISFFML